VYEFQLWVPKNGLITEVRWTIKKKCENDKVKGWFKIPLRLLYQIQARFVCSTRNSLPEFLRFFSVLRISWSFWRPKRWILIVKKESTRVPSELFEAKNSTNNFQVRNHKKEHTTRATSLHSATPQLPRKAPNATQQTCTVYPALSFSPNIHPPAGLQLKPKVTNPIIFTPNTI